MCQVRVGTGVTHPMGETRLRYVDTWTGPSSLNGPAQLKAHKILRTIMGQPNNDLLNKGPFTAQSQIWPVNCSPNIWAHLRPEARSGPLIVRRIFGPTTA